MQEIRLDGGEGLLLAQVENKGAIDPVPADPALHVGGTAIQVVGKGCLAQRLILIVRRSDPGHLRPRGLVGLRLGQEAFLIKRVILLGRVIALVERLHAIAGGPLVEPLQLLPDRRLVLVVGCPGDLQLGVHQGDTRQANAVEIERIVRHGPLGLVEQLVIGLHQLRTEHSILMRDRRVVNP